MNKLYDITKIPGWKFLKFIWKGQRILVAVFIGVSPILILAFPPDAAFIIPAAIAATLISALMAIIEAGKIPDYSDMLPIMNAFSHNQPSSR